MATLFRAPRACLIALLALGVLAPVPGLAFVAPLETQEILSPGPGLAYQQIDPWTGRYASWSLSPDGQGWLETNQPLRIAQSDSPDSLYFEAGRYPIVAGADGYAEILALFASYVSGAEGEGPCTGIVMDDQPQGTLWWRGQPEADGRYHADLGCQAVAAQVAEAWKRIGESVVAPDVPD